MSFCEKLKELREKKGMSQTDLARAIFVSRSAVAKWENGLGLPSDPNMKALSEFFGVSEEDLLDRQDLKEYVRMSRPKIKNCIASVFGIALPVAALILSFAIIYEQPITISVTCPPINIWHCFIPWTFSIASTLLGFALAAGVSCFALSVLSLFVGWFKKHDKAIFWTIVVLCVAIPCLALASFCAFVYEYRPGNFIDLYVYLYGIFG